MSIRTVGVVGAGAMGCGIAQVTAMDGRYAVILHDTDEAALDRGSVMIQRNREKLVAKGSVTEEEKASVESRISGTADPAGLKQADMVIEAIVEKEEAKEAVFRQLGALCKKGTILWLRIPPRCPLRALHHVRRNLPFLSGSIFSILYRLCDWLRLSGERRHPGKPPEG